MLPREVGTPESTACLPENPTVPLPSLSRTALAEASGVPPGGLAALPPMLSSGPDAQALFSALRRRWLLALTLGILAAGGAVAAVWFLLPASYTVFAQVHIASTQPSLMGGNHAEGRAEFPTYLKTQMGRIRGRFVLLAALKRDEVKRLDIINRQPVPVAWVEEELKVESPDGSELVTLSMTGPNPDELIPLINAIAQSYLQEVNQDETKRRGGHIAELEKAYTDFKEALRKRKEQRAMMAKDPDVADPQAFTQKNILLVTSLQDYRSRHTQAASELMKARNRLEYHKALEPTLDQQPIPDAVLNEIVEADQKVRQQLAKLADYDEQIAGYEQVAVRPNEASLVNARARRAAVQKQLDARREELRVEAQQRYRSKARADYEAALIQYQNEIPLLEKQEQTLQAEVNRLLGEMEKVKTSSTALEMLSADIKQDEQTASDMARELDKLKVEQRSPLRVSLYQEAAAQRKDRKRQLLALVGAPLAALFGVCLAVSWWEFRGRRIHTPDEVLTGLGMRVVGAVPAFPRNTPVPLLPGAADTDGLEHSLLESIDGIRTLLLRDDSTRVLMVTSAVSGEGKTTLATHLAGSLARAGRRTLLIDCDLRRPTIHQLFELPPQPGLSEVLLGEVHLAEATLATPVDGLWVVAAGQWDRDVMQALAKDGAQAVFEKLKSEYDFIVVDSHPVLPATDSLLIGQHVDAVILSLLRDVSQMPKVYAACHRLTSLGIRVLGAVVNGTREDAYGNGYRYGAQQPQQT